MDGRSRLSARDEREAKRRIPVRNGTVQRDRRLRGSLGIRETRGHRHVMEVHLVYVCFRQRRVGQSEARVPLGRARVVSDRLLELFARPLVPRIAAEQEEPMCLGVARRRPRRQDGLMRVQNAVDTVRDLALEDLQR